jgi:hypothetical protein
MDFEYGTGNLKTLAPERTYEIALVKVYQPCQWFGEPFTGPGCYSRTAIRDCGVEFTGG